jgi:hypothetical protein
LSDGLIRTLTPRMVMLTNIAGAVQWFNADSSNASRKTYTGPLTNGTPGVPDNQDAFTVTVGAIAGPALVVTKSSPATMNLGHLFEERWTRHQEKDAKQPYQGADGHERTRMQARQRAAIRRVVICHRQILELTHHPVCAG